MDGRNQNRLPLAGSRWIRIGSFLLEGFPFVDEAGIQPLEVVPGLLDDDAVQRDEADEVKICTIPIGYADGLRRGLSGNTDVIFQGNYYRQVGNICMDQCMFEYDLRNRSMRQRVEPQVGDEVLLVGEQGVARITIDEMAEKLGTIQHEISIGFAQRMPRIFT